MGDTYCEIEMEENNNVVYFPKEKKGSPPQSFDEVIAKVIKNRVTYSNSFCSDLMDVIYAYYLQDNIDIEEEFFYNEFCLVRDSVQSLHMKAHGLGHLLQEVAADLYSDQSEDVDIEYLLDELESSEEIIGD